MFYGQAEYFRGNINYICVAGSYDGGVIDKVTGGFEPERVSSIPVALQIFNVT